MPRDSSGNYTLPAGNPVVTDTVISPTWANPTMDDLGAEFQDSLSRSGKGGMLVPFLNADGNQANPGISFTSEPNSGLYRAATGELRLSVLGVDVARWSSLGLSIWKTTDFQFVPTVGSDEAITGTWTYSVMPRVVSGVTDYPIVPPAGTVGQALVKVDSEDYNTTWSDVAAGFDPALDYTITGKWTFTDPECIIDLIRARDLVDQTSGANITGLWQFNNPGTLIADQLGSGRKVGWRNPNRLALTNADQTVAQTWEGLCADMTPTVPRTITIPAGLEQGTSFRIFNNGDTVNIRITPDVGTFLYLYAGSGVREGSGSFDIPGGGVAEIYSPAPDVWRIFGSQIEVV